AMIARDRYDGMGAKDQRLYALSDANFNVTAIVSAGGTLQERCAYDPYGAVTVLNASWGSATPGFGWGYLHPGGRLAAATADYSLRHRDENPELGRWGMQDPIAFKAGDSNLYRDETGNPLLHRDPDGTACAQQTPIPYVLENPWILPPAQGGIVIPPLPGLFEGPSAPGLIPAAPGAPSPFSPFGPGFQLKGISPLSFSFPTTIG